jgi:hypothetical protein
MTHLFLRRFKDGTIEFWGTDGDPLIGMPRCYQKITGDDRLLKSVWDGQQYMMQEFDHQQAYDGLKSAQEGVRFQ